MLFVLCEGPTETFFVSRVLNPWLTAQGKWAVPIAADGLRPFARVRKDILRLLRNPLARVTTLIDYYGTPSDYPGMPHARLPPGNPAAVYGEVARLDLALGVSLSLIHISRGMLRPFVRPANCERTSTAHARFCQSRWTRGFRSTEQYRRVFPRIRPRRTEKLLKSTKRCSESGQALRPSLYGSGVHQWSTPESLRATSWFW